MRRTYFANDKAGNPAAKMKSIGLVVLCIFAVQVMFLNEENTNTRGVVRIVVEDMNVVRQRNLNMNPPCDLSYNMVAVQAPEEEEVQGSQVEKEGQVVGGGQGGQQAKVEGQRQHQRQRRLNDNVHPVNCTQFQWYGHSNTPSYPTDKRTWQDAWDFCSAQGKWLCRKDEYCIYGPGAPPVGGRRANGWLSEGDKWAPAGDKAHTWVQVGVWWLNDTSTTCRTHEEMFWPVDDAWSTGSDIEFFEWIACCSG